MEGLDSYNFLMMVNSIQEQSIKELFQSRKWTCLYKVLPLSCSYLWGLYDDEDRVTDEQEKQHTQDQTTKDQITQDQTIQDQTTKGQTTQDQTIQDQNPCKLSENSTNFGSVISIAALNSKNNEMVNVRSSNFAFENSLNGEREVNKTQKKKCDVHEYVKKIVIWKKTKQNDKHDASSNSDTDDYDIDNVATDKMRNHSELQKEFGKQENESETMKKDTTERETIEYDQTVLLKDTETNNEPRIKRNGIMHANKRQVERTCTSVSTKVYAENKKELRQSVMKSKKIKDVKLSKDSKICVTENKVNNRVKEIEQTQTEVTETSGKCNIDKQFLYIRNDSNQIFCQSCETCYVCGKVFPNTSRGLKKLKIHLRAHKGQRPFKCSECPATFRADAHLVRHKEAKHNPEPKLVSCDICSKSFQKQYLKTHISNMHSGRTASYRCDICGNTFRYKGSLTQHMISVHAKQRDYLCDICSSSFTSSHNLRLHRVRHEADHKLTCNICGKILQAGSGFRDHMRRHANERQYQCGKCPKSFYSRRDLVTHYKIHTGERPYECHLCTYSCAIKGNLTKHMKRHKSGDVVPEHKYKGHCDLETVARNIAKIKYKDVRTDGGDGGDVKHEKETDGMEMDANAEKHVEVTDSRFKPDSDNVIGKIRAEIPRTQQAAHQISVVADACKGSGFNSATSNGQTTGLVNMETNVFNSQIHIMQPSTSFSVANYSVTQHDGLPLDYKSTQPFNPEQPYTQHSDAPIYYN